MKNILFPLSFFFAFPVNLYATPSTSQHIVNGQNVCLINVIDQHQNPSIIVSHITYIQPEFISIPTQLFDSLRMIFNIHEAHHCASDDSLHMPHNNKNDAQFWFVLQREIAADVSATQYVQQQNIPFATQAISLFKFARLIGDVHLALNNEKNDHATALFLFNNQTNPSIKQIQAYLDDLHFFYKQKIIQYKKQKSTMHLIHNNNHITNIDNIHDVQSFLNNLLQNNSLSISQSWIANNYLQGIKLLNKNN